MQTLDRDEVSATIDARPDVVYAIDSDVSWTPEFSRRSCTAHGSTGLPDRRSGHGSRRPTGSTRTARSRTTLPS